MIRQATIEDALIISNIYNYYVINTAITFEEEAVPKKEMVKRIQSTTQKLPWLVYELDNVVVGYAYASEWKSRCAYKNSLETTVYLKHGLAGKGIGSALYKELISILKEKGYHALIGGISLPNEASIAIHEKFGFHKVAQFKEVGNKFNKWIDVGYWELIIS